MGILCSEQGGIGLKVILKSGTKCVCVREREGVNTSIKGVRHNERRVDLDHADA